MKKINESTKVTLTLKQLKKLVKESEGDSTSTEFDISAAIKSGNYKIQGIRGDKPNPVNVRMFAICMYQKSEKGWLNLDLVFDMAYAWAMFYDGKQKKDRPWDERRIGSRDGSLLIDDSLFDELKSNPDLHKAIEDHVEYCCRGNFVDEKKDMVFKKLENLKVSGTNRFAQSAIDTSNHEKALKDAVEYCKATYPQIIGGHSTQWYDQGGPGDPWDYDGDDDLSLERTFEIFDIDSKEKVDALAKAGKMSKTVEKGNFSTTYKVVFKNDDSDKVTLTMEQLKKLVNEYEHYYDPETGMTYDDEGNSWYGPPNPKYDVSDTPWRPRAGGYSSGRSRYHGGGYRRSSYSSSTPTEIESDKFFANNSAPKSESQAVWHLYQIVSIADKKKKPPQPVTGADLINRMIECLKALGLWSPNEAKLDEILSKPARYRPDGGAYARVPMEVLQNVKKAILSGNVSSLDTKTHVIAGRGGGGTQTYLSLSGGCKFAFEYDSILAAFGINNIYTIRKVMLEYYKQDKAARDASKIKEELSRFNKGEYAEALLRSFFRGFEDFRGNFNLAKADDEAKPSDSKDDEGEDELEVIDHDEALA